MSDRKVSYRLATVRNINGSIVTVNSPAGGTEVIDNGLHADNLEVGDLVRITVEVISTISKYS